MNSYSTKGTFKSYLIFWIGQLVSLLGSSIISFAIVWWITVKTGSAFLLGYANFIGMLPLIVLTPIFGVYIDKWNRKLIIALADFSQALITFWIIMLFFFGKQDVILIIYINGLRGICQAFHFPTVKAIIPIMIPKKYLSRMNAIDYMFNGMVRIFGPVIGAFLYAFLPIVTILWIDIITFVIAIIPLILIRIPKIQIQVKKEGASFFKDFKIGVDGLNQVPGLVTLLILISVVNFLGQPVGTLLPLYIESTHSGNATDLAIVMAFIQTGMIFGALLTSFKKDWRNRVYVMTGSILISVVGYFVIGLSPTGFFILIGIGGMIRAAMVPLINTNFLTIIQLHVAPDLQGKVMSIVVSLAWAVIPLGSIVAGPLAELMGIRLLYIASAILVIFTVLITLLFTNVRLVKFETIYEPKGKN